MSWGCLHRDLPLKSVDADFGEGTVTVYFKDMNIKQRKMILASREKGPQEAVIESLMIRARDASGMRMFKESDRDRIEAQFDPDEVDRVVIEMNKREDPAGN